MQPNLATRIFSSAVLLMKKFSIWIIVLQVIIVVSLMSVHSFQRNRITGFGWQEGPFTGSSGTVAFTELVSENLPRLPQILTLTNDSKIYFTEIVPGVSCFRHGIDLEKSLVRKKCSCSPGYFGSDCGVPEPVWFSCINEICKSQLIKRRTPRRIIHGININHELEFFEARLKEIGDVVDVLIVGESNYTAGGDSTELYLLPELKKGFMAEYQHKIIHVLIDQFPPEGFVDGWFADTFIRDYMAKEGLTRIQGIQDDDLFLLLDADEIPDKRVLLFLKLYDGYPEPISLSLRWSVYGFFWKRKRNDVSNEEDLTRIVAISTMRMIREVYDGKVMSMRRNHLNEEPVSSKYRKYASENGPLAHEWNIGTVGHYAGFHCSWCYKPEGIRLKLLSAQKNDKPRWGDYPEKLDLNYISNLIKNGMWFDDSQPFFLVKPQQDSHYAPNFFLLNRERFEYLLTPPKRKN